MARGSGLGKQVKTFVQPIPQPDLTHQHAKISVYFQAADGLFSIAVPEHIADFIGSRTDFDVKAYRAHSRLTQAATLDGVISGFKATIGEYERLIKDIAREKVIVITFKANISSFKLAGGRIKPADMFSSPSPALALTFQVLWRIGNGLYRASTPMADEPIRFTYIRQDPTSRDAPRGYDSGETFVIDWTQEREDFFESMDQAMTTLIQRICDMLFGDTAEAVDRMIAGGGMLSLPAPDPTDKEGWNP